ncbi:hypothetical protein MMH89_02425 [Candidatus Comchoanobacter bicostacola]|uniref:Alpha/beta hydrolase n=1 Tax=Candidatus Comchoanobacter bicostacola TaxID=2919598 RepID=A0ABY5DJS8_9GAMM|nr:hypothetical protein [Candidatus Comchoanobacter bicostacola]UTC24082.1 hypothetical protein MMH89_02425 [Candidatus Comchoanobacter bicostacola]
MNKFSKTILKPIRSLLGSLLYPASHSSEETSAKFDDSNKLYIPGNGEVLGSTYCHKRKFLPAPAYYKGKDAFSLMSYQRNVYAHISHALKHNDEVDVVGWSMGGAALMLAVSQLTKKQLSGKKINIKIVSTFGSLSEVVSKQVLLNLIVLPILYAISLPFLLVIGLNPLELPEVLMVLICAPVLYAVALITAVIEKIMIIKPVRKLLDRVKGGCFKMVSNYLMKLMDSNHNVWKAADTFSQKDLSNASLKIYQAMDDSLIQTGTRLADRISTEKPSNIEIYKFRGDHTYFPDFIAKPA